MWVVRKSALQVALYESTKMSLKMAFSFEEMSAKDMKSLSDIQFCTEIDSIVCVEFCFKGDLLSTVFCITYV